MGQFTPESARKAGMKSKRGPSKATVRTRSFIFEILKENREKLKYMLEELSPKEFCDIYLKLIPYILSPRTSQSIEVGEISKQEIDDLIGDIVKGE